MNTIKLNSIGDSPVVVKKGSQVQSQEKTVEITENGTTEVVPDSGYALSKVTVNTNVESSGSAMEYIDISGLSEQYKTPVINFAGMLLKINIDETIVIASGGVTVMYQSSAILSGALAIGYIPTVEIDMGQQGKGTIQYFIEQLENMGITLPRITKEEFYSLGSEFVSIRDLYQPTTSDVDMNTGYFDGVTNCDKVTEVQVLGPTVYEEVDQLAVTFMNTSKNLIASLATNTIDADSRLIWTTESATDGVSSGVIYTITPDNVVTRNEEEIDKFNAILAGDDFRYAIANMGAGFTEAQFDILDKFIKVKKG